MTLSPRSRKAAVPLMILAGLAVGGLGARFMLPAPPALMVAISGAIVIAALVVSVLCWRALDEVARDAHKTAWYWGGSTGMFAAFIAFIVLKKVNPELLIAGRGPMDLIEFGLIGVIIAQLIGYLVVWAGWWFVRR